MFASFFVAAASSGGEDSCLLSGPGTTAASLAVLFGRGHFFPRMSAGGGGCGSGAGLGYVANATWAAQVAHDAHQATVASLQQEASELGHTNFDDLTAEDTAADVCEKICAHIVSDVINESGQDPSKRAQGLDYCKLVRLGGTTDEKSFGELVVLVSSEAGDFCDVSLSRMLTNSLPTAQELLCVCQVLLWLCLCTQHPMLEDSGFCSIQKAAMPEMALRGLHAASKAR